MAAEGRAAPARFGAAGLRAEGSRAGRPCADGGSRSIRAGSYAAIEENPRIELRREEATSIARDAITIVATGPLTSDALAEEIGRLTGAERLFFYDSISPIVDADSIDLSIAFRASRYGKSLDGTRRLPELSVRSRAVRAIRGRVLAAEPCHAHIPEDQRRFFEACLPIEELARRGRETLRFGPMKPMGLTDPRTGRRPYAVVQLAPGKSAGGSATTWSASKITCVSPNRRACFDMIPGLETRRISALRADSSQHLYQRARAAHSDASASHGASRFLRRTDFGRGRLRGIHRHRLGRRTTRGGAGAGAEIRPFPARDRYRIAVRLCFGRRCRATTSRPTSRSICCPRSMKRRGMRFRHDKQARHAEVCRARSRSWTNIGRFMPDLVRTDRAFPGRAAASERVRSTRCETMRRIWINSSLISRFPIKQRPTVEEIDALAIREWLGHLYRAAADGGEHAPEAGGRAFVLQIPVARRSGREERRAHGAHAEGAQDAAGRDDRRANQRAGGWRYCRRRTSSNGPIRRAIWRSSNCCTVAGCASANWWA